MCTHELNPDVRTITVAIMTKLKNIVKRKIKNNFRSSYLLFFCRKYNLGNICYENRIRTNLDVFTQGLDYL